MLADGEKLCDAGAPGTHLHILDEGVAKACDAGGSERTRYTGRKSAGAEAKLPYAFGEMCLLEDVTCERRREASRTFFRPFPFGDLPSLSRPARATW